MDGQNIIFGRNPVKEALRANKVTCVFINDAFNDRTILDLIKLQHINVKKISNAELDHKCNGVHQGIMANIKPYEYLDFEEEESSTHKQINITQRSGCQFSNNPIIL